MSVNEDLEFIQKHKTKGALFDANLLLVYVAGKANRSRLARWDRTQQYADDYPHIERLVEFFHVVYTIPNVLTEVSNLGAGFGPEFFWNLRNVIQLHVERYCASSDAVKSNAFQRLGLTDSALLEVGKDVLIVTTDWQLHRTLRDSGIDAVNFNHLRPFLWQQ